MSTVATQPDKKVIESMLASGCHFGHRASKWNPKMRKYLFGERDGIHVFDLSKTYECLGDALSFIREASSQGKSILLVSTKLQSTKLVAQSAQEVGCAYVTRKWMPGLLTNFDTIKKRIKYFRDLKSQKDTQQWDKYTKKERLELQRDLEKLEDAFGGVEDMVKLPDVIIVLDALRDELALKEAKRLKIPTVGVCDSNSNPDLVTYPIPGNDDAVKSLRFFMDKIAGAIQEGRTLSGKEAKVSEKVEVAA